MNHNLSEIARGRLVDAFRGRSAPLLLAALAFITGIGFAGWAATEASQAATTAQRLEQILIRSRAAATSLVRLTPAHMPADGSRLLMERLEKCLKSAESGSNAIVAANQESTGSLVGVSSQRQHFRVELAGLHLSQVAAALNAIESSGLPCWIDSLELSAASGGGDKWNAILQVGWLSKPSDARS